MKKMLLFFMIFAPMVMSQNTFDEYDGLSDKIVNIKLYHKFGSTHRDYSLSKTIVLRGNNERDAVVKQEYQFTQQDLAELKKLAEENGLYHLKAVAYKSNEETKVVYTFLEACSLIESDLQDTLTISLDSYGSLMSLSATTTNPQCVPSSIPLKLTNFNTSLKIVQTAAGPVPDTQTYIQRMEQERAERAKGDKADNRSFLAKYWIYILPLVIFMLISSAANPEGQGEAS